MVCGFLFFIVVVVVFFFFKQKTAYEMRISDWSSDVCSSDLGLADKFGRARLVVAGGTQQREHRLVARDGAAGVATGHAGNLHVLVQRIDRRRLEVRLLRGPRDAVDLERRALLGLLQPPGALPAPDLATAREL